MEETNLYNKIKELEHENALLKEKLKNYTAPKRSKTFYENHKEDVLQKNKEYKEKTNYYSNLSPEKKKEYAKRAYLNKKEKIKKLTECWINTQKRPVEFQIQASSFTCGNKKAGLSKTIGVKETPPNG